MHVVTWLFALGSASMLARPAIRLVRRGHVGRVRDGAGAGVGRGTGHEPAFDF